MRVRENTFLKPAFVRKKKNLYQELTLNLVPSAKPALQGKKLFKPSNTNASNFIFSLSLSLSLSVFLWLFNNEAENVGIAICRCRKSWQLASLPVKELVAVRPTPREFLTKGAPGLPSLSHTHTHTQTAKDTWEGPNPLVIISKIRKSPPLRGVVCSQGGANQSG